MIEYRGIFERKMLFYFTIIFSLKSGNHSFHVMQNYVVRYKKGSVKLSILDDHFKCRLKLV